MIDLSNYRENYTFGSLDESGLPPDPEILFESWFNNVLAGGTTDPNAMVLATASSGGFPSARMVLLKGLDKRGFIFFTSYLSRKAGELAINPRAALLFFWKEYQQEVRVEGYVEKLPVAESDRYFLQRPPESRISAVISPQSQRIPDRKWLEDKVTEFNNTHPEGAIIRPDTWGGYLLIPEIYEFWQGRENRLHDRIQYSRKDNEWIINRLAP